jgi:hypothetical protein
VKYLSIPRYRVRPSPERFLFNKLLVLLGLGVLLYLGVFVNYYLLSSSIPKYWNWLFIIGIMLLVLLELILCRIKYGNYIYEFYDEKITLNYSKVHEIAYSSIAKLGYTVDLFDKWFKTGTIVVTLSDGRIFKLKYLNNPNQAYLLVQRHLK